MPEKTYTITTTREVEIDPDRVEEYVRATYDPDQYAELTVTDPETGAVVVDRIGDLTDGAPTPDEDDVDDQDVDDDRPDTVPAKASVVIKEINENRYYYWQWRAGDTVKSKYKGPVSADD